MTLPEMVYVCWVDAFKSDVEQTFADLAAEERDFLVHTIGFLVGGDKRFVTLAHEAYHDGLTVRGTTTIPRSLVRDLIVLKRVRK